MLFGGLAVNAADHRANQPSNKQTNESTNKPRKQGKVHKTKQRNRGRANGLLRIAIGFHSTAATLRPLTPTQRKLRRHIQNMARHFDGPFYYMILCRFHPARIITRLAFGGLSVLKTIQNQANNTPT